MNSPISNFYKNQTIFLTGGSGLVGKLVTEKLLRSCDVKKIYLLMRSKKGTTSQERFEHFFNNPCFDRIKNKEKEKVFLVRGDCNEHFIGLSNEDIIALKEETTCIFHFAGSVKFDQPLKQASSALRATIHILELARQMRNLKVFVYTSTACSNYIHSYIKEEFYQPPIKPQTLLDLVNNLDDTVLQKITPLYVFSNTAMLNIGSCITVLFEIFSLLGKWPNTYVYTKCIVEDAIKQAYLNIPVVIIRPVAITNTINEPIPGWIENAAAFIGIMVAIYTGILRSFRVGLDKHLNLVPADYVCNSILAATWKEANEKSNIPIIYNIVGDRITYEKAINLFQLFYWEFPSDKYWWYSSVKLRKDKCLHYVHYYLYLSLAYLIDTIRVCFGKQRIIARKYKIINTGIDLLSDFTVREWQFDERNVIKLWNAMNENDKQIYKFNQKISDLYGYVRNCAIGVRIYFLQDPLYTLPQAKRKLKMLFVFHYTIVALWYFCLYKFVLFILSLWVQD